MGLERRTTPTAGGVEGGRNAVAFRDEVGGQAIGTIYLWDKDVTVRRSHQPPVSSHPQITRRVRSAGATTSTLEDDDSFATQRVTTAFGRTRAPPRRAMLTITKEPPRPDDDAVEMEATFDQEEPGIDIDAEQNSVRDDDDPCFHHNPFAHHFESAEMELLLRNSYKEYKKIPVSERTKSETVLRYTSIFPEWVTRHAIFSSVDGVIRAREVRDAFSADPGNRSPKQLDRVAFWLRDVWKSGKSMSTEDIEALAHCVHFEEVKGNELLAKEGHVGYALFIVVDGTVEARGKQGTVLLGPGDSFGDGVLRTGREVWSRSMTAKVTPTGLLKVRKSALDGYHKDRQASNTHQAMRCFRTNPMFRGWPRSKLEKMCHMVKRKVYKAGDVIIRQDDTTDDVYFIIEGKCEVYKEVTLATRNRWPKTQAVWEEKVRSMLLPFKILEMGVGEYFGERAILRDTGRAATVVAAERTVCMSLGKNQFLNLLQRGATVVESVYAQSNSYPSDEEVLTLFTALRIQHRHEGLIRDSINKNREGFRPGEDDISIRKTDLKNRDVLTLPKRYGRLTERSRERSRRDSVIMSTASAKPSQTGRIVNLARNVVCSSQHALSKNDIKRMLREGKALPSSFATDILRRLALSTREPPPTKEEDNKLLSTPGLSNTMAGTTTSTITHQSPIGRYLSIQDTLPTLITIKYKTSNPQLAPVEEKEPYPSSGLRQPRSLTFLKLPVAPPR